MKVKTCPQCGTIFEAHNERQIYCKLSCRERRKYEVAKSKSASSPIKGYFSRFTQCIDLLGDNLAEQIFDAVRQNDSRRYCAFKLASPDILTNKPDYIDITPDEYNGIHYYLIERAA